MEARRGRRSRNRARLNPWSSRVIEKAVRRLDDLVRVLGMGIMATAGQNQPLDRPRDMLLDQVQLLERAIGVLITLDQQQRAAHLSQAVDHGPGALGWVQLHSSDQGANPQSATHSSSVGSKPNVPVRLPSGRSAYDFTAAVQPRSPSMADFAKKSETGLFRASRTRVARSTGSQISYTPLSIVKRLFRMHRAQM